MDKVQAKLVLTQHTFETMKQQQAANSEKKRQMDRFVAIRAALKLKAGKPPVGPPPGLPPTTPSADKLAVGPPPGLPPNMPSPRPPILPPPPTAGTRESNEDFDEDVLVLTRKPAPVALALDGPKTVPPATLAFPLPPTHLTPSKVLAPIEPLNTNGNKFQLQVLPSSLVPSQQQQEPCAISPQSNLAWLDDIKKTTGPSYLEPTMPACMRYFVYLFSLAAISAVMLLLVFFKAKTATVSARFVVFDYTVVLFASVLVWEVCAAQVVAKFKRAQSFQNNGEFDVKTSEELSGRNCHRSSSSRNGSRTRRVSVSLARDNFTAVGVK